MNTKSAARKTGGVVLAAFAVASIANASPSNPAALYSESRVGDADSKVVRRPPAEKTVVTRISSWVNQTVSQYWPAAASSETSAPISKTQMVVAPTSRTLSAPVGLERKSSGVAIYQLESSPSVPRLNIGIEPSVRVSDYALDSRTQATMNSRVMAPFPSPYLLLTSQMRELTTLKATPPISSSTLKIRDVVFSPKGKVSREEFDRIVRHLAPERPLNLNKFKELSPDEIRFLSGLLLYQQGGKCPVAVGLFHQLSKSKAYEAEAGYYVAMCSRKLGLETDFFGRAQRILETQDVYYSRKIIKEIGYEIPYEFNDSLGLALLKVSANQNIMSKLDAKTLANVAFILADFGAASARFTTALTWSKKVPLKHPRYPQAKFIEALADYQTGAKDAAMKLEEELIADIGIDKQKSEFQALVALNAARMYFQDQKFKPAHEAFLKVYKDHPLWLQSLTEMGWSQLMSGDFEGAIGNMYSIQSPFFSAVYKPESFVIRTIGYLNLCQYGDAYKTLSMMEHEYRPDLEKMNAYAASRPSYYQTVRHFMSAPKKATEVDGLPLPVIREMARHRDFTNLQKALNRQIEELALNAKLDGEAAKDLKHAQGLVTHSRQRIALLRSQLAKIDRTPALEGNRAPIKGQLDKELSDLNDYFFQIDLFNEATASLPDYRKAVASAADARLTSMRSTMEKVLSNRLLAIKTDLARYIDNNELLRYEVFNGAGENIRYQVAGGETANRVPASIIPKSKSLQWDFDGEYWEDEIGHYRSGLKNNCATASGNVQLKQANTEGADE